MSQGGWDMLRECEADNVTVRLASSSAGPIEIDWAALKSGKVGAIEPELSARPERFVWNVEATDSEGSKWTDSVHETAHGADEAADALRVRPSMKGGMVRTKAYRVWR